MKESSIERTLLNLLLACLISVTFFVSPWNSVDPINLPKMSLLGVWGFGIAAFVFLGGKTNFQSINRKLRILVSIFLLQSLIVFVVTDSDWAFKLYGTPGRNTGFLTYSILSVLLIASASISSKISVKRYFISLVVTGVALATYGGAQAFGYEMFSYVSQYTNNVFSTFGNTNFHSAFMGLVGAALLTQAVLGSHPIGIRITFIFMVVIILINISLSSSQGFLGFVGGFLSAITLYLFQNEKLFKGKVLFGFCSIGFFFIVCAVFNVGPLAGFIYEASLKARGFYWQAAIQILIDKPVFGVGFDGFGDWYRRARSDAAFEYNPGVLSDSAHNVPLDIGASGGIVLLAAYLSIQFLVLRTIWINTRDHQVYDPFHLSLFAAWVAYQLQSLLSINQIGLGIWGWTLSGLLIGYNKDTVNSGKVRKRNSGRASAIINEKSQRKKGLVTIVSVVLGLLASTPPYFAANNFYKALQSGNYQILKSSAYLKPLDRTRFFNVSLILSQSNQAKEALTVLLDATRIYPDYYSAWMEIEKNPEATPLQVKKAQLEIQRLEPRQVAQPKDQ